MDRSASAKRSIRLEINSIIITKSQFLICSVVTHSSLFGQREDHYAVPVIGVIHLSVRAEAFYCDT